MQEKSSSYECFHAHNDIVTVALFAPSAARRKLPSRAMSQSSKVSVSSPRVFLPCLWLASTHCAFSAPPISCPRASCPRAPRSAAAAHRPTCVSAPPLLRVHSMCMLGTTHQLPLPGLSQDLTIGIADTNVESLAVMSRLC